MLLPSISVASTHLPVSEDGVRKAIGIAAGTSRSAGTSSSGVSLPFVSRVE
jgi:hypothetical protein